MGRLFDLIEAHMNAQPYKVLPADVARELGVSRQTVLNWREPSQLLDLKNLQGISRLTGVPYIRVLDANLEDIGYIPKSEPKPDPEVGREAG